MLKAVGYWKNSSNWNFPNPKNYICSYPEGLKVQIIDYLNKGHKYISWRGFSACRFNCGIESRNMGSKCLTDNAWKWPEGLSHYIEKHNVALPDEFIENMKTNKWQIPQLSVEYIGEKEFDYSTWKKYKKEKKHNKAAHLISTFLRKGSNR